MRTSPRVLLLSTTLAAASVALPACQTGGSMQSSAAPTVQTARQLQTALDRTDAEVVASLDALDRIRMDDLDKGAAYEQLGRRLESLQADQQAFDGQAAELREQARAYEQQWNQDAQTIRDADMRRTALDRQLSVQESLEAVTDQYGATSDKLDPFVREVQGIHTYLGNDLTPRGIEAIGSQFDQAETKAQGVRDSLDKLQQELRKMTGTLDEEAGTGPAMSGGSASGGQASSSSVRSSGSMGDAMTKDSPAMSGSDSMNGKAGSVDNVN